MREILVRDFEPIPPPRGQVEVDDNSFPQWFFKNDIEALGQNHNKWHIIGPRTVPRGNLLIAFCGHGADAEETAIFANKGDWDLFETDICKHCLRAWRAKLMTGETK